MSVCGAHGCVRLFGLVVWVSSGRCSDMELLGPSLSLVVACVLKPILSGISIAT